MKSAFIAAMHTFFDKKKFRVCLDDLLLQPENRRIIESEDVIKIASSVTFAMKPLSL